MKLPQAVHPVRLRTVIGAALAAAALLALPGQAAFARPPARSARRRRTATAGPSR
jgi:hypothetical protein